MKHCCVFKCWRLWVFTQSLCKQCCPWLWIKGIINVHWCWSFWCTWMQKQWSQVKIWEGVCCRLQSGWRILPWMPLRLQSNLGRWVAGLILVGASEPMVLLDVCGKMDDPHLWKSVLMGLHSKLIENETQLVNVSKTASLNLEAFCGLQLLGWIFEGQWIVALNMCKKLGFWSIFPYRKNGECIPNQTIHNKVHTENVQGCKFSAHPLRTVRPLEQLFALSCSIYLPNWAVSLFLSNWNRAKCSRDQLTVFLS